MAFGRNEEQKQVKEDFVKRNWYKALKRIKKIDGRVGRPSHLIYLRNRSFFSDRFWQHGGYTSTTLDYFEDNPILLLRDNSELLQLANAKKAVKTYKKGREYDITKEEYKKHLSQAEKEAKKNPENKSIFILPEREPLFINLRDNFDLLRFLSEDSDEAERYMRRLANEKINDILFNVIDKDKVDDYGEPFQSQLWLYDINGRSLITGCGNTRGLVYGCNVFYVSQDFDEKIEQETGRRYSQQKSCILAILESMKPEELLSN